MGAHITKGGCCDGHDAMLHQGVSICVEPTPLGAAVAGFAERDEFLHQLQLSTRAEHDSDPTELAIRWSGFREFIVVSRQKETSEITSFFLKCADCLQETFHFLPGQALRVKVVPDDSGVAVNRDYTVVSAPGEHFLQIAVKRLPVGKVSTFLHDRAIEGSKLLVAKPSGKFTAMRSSQASAILLSAGIGITPMVALVQQLGVRVALAAHVDKSEEAHPFRQMFLDAGVKTQVHYTRKNGRPPRDIGARLVRSTGVDHDWYICGPRTFMNDAVDTLSDAGVDSKRIHIESFRVVQQPQVSPVQVLAVEYGCWVSGRPQKSPWSLGDCQQAGNEVIGR